MALTNPESYAKLRAAITERIGADRQVLDDLRVEIRPLRDATQPITRRTVNAVSLVAADGGNNQLRFDPFLVQLVRVVDSANNEHSLEVISPTMDIAELSRRNLTEGTALGNMMRQLGVSHLNELSSMIGSDKAARPRSDDSPASAGWVKNYRELTEWAVLLNIVQKKDFGTDTLLVYDGLLRSKSFRGELFRKYMWLIYKAMERHLESQRRIYLVGVAKRSKALERYRLAMALEGILTTDYAAYCEVPDEIEKKAYKWLSYSQERESAEFVTKEGAQTSLNNSTGGKLFFAKFGNRPHDPIWPVDIFLPQSKGSWPASIFSFLLGDAQDGFPIPFYPRSLQQAHENAALIDFDYEMLQDEIFQALRQQLTATGQHALDAFQLQDFELAQLRYS